MRTLIADSMPEQGEMGGEWSHMAALRVAPREIGEDEAAADWFAACHRLTPRVERTGRWSALLDLGTCTDDEAVAALCSLLEWLTAAGFEPAAGIAPSAALAQLAHLSGAPQRPLVILTPAEIPAFLKSTPVAALLHLHPRGLVTPEVVERLRRYGLRTLGHVARIGELALRRQFGAAGSFLAALAQGRDACPLCPTPLPAELRIRARFAMPVTPEELLAALPRLAERAAERVRTQGRQARSLRIVVRWESGAIGRSCLTLRQYTDSPTLLTQEMGRLLATEVAPGGLAATTSACADAETVGYDRVEELRLTLADFAPAVPDQATFWRTRTQQVAALEQVAETLARRHGRPLLLRPRLAIPAAIFAEERYRFALPDVALPDVALPDVALPDVAFADATESTGMVDVVDLRTRHMRPKRPARADVSDVGDADAGGDAWRDVPQRVHWW